MSASTEPRPQRKRKAPDVRRREILMAVVGVAERNGWDGVTLRDVARRAGVAPGLIHHYFPSMDQLLAESFGDWADKTLRDLIRASEGEDPATALAIVVAALTAEQLLWHEALGSSLRFSMLLDRARELSVSYQEYVESVIVRGVELGEFSCAEPGATAWRFILLLDGMLPMVYTLEVLSRRDIPRLIGPLVEHELGLGAGVFTERALRVAERVDRGEILPAKGGRPRP